MQRPLLVRSIALLFLIAFLPTCKTFARRAASEQAVEPPTPNGVLRDLARIPEHLIAIQELRGKTLAVAREIREAGASPDSLYTPAQVEKILTVWSQLLFHNNQLMEIYRENSGFAAATDPATGRRALAAYVVSGFAVYRNAVLVTAVFDGNKRARKKLNEAYVPLGIPDRQYDVLRSIALDDDNFKATARSLQYFSGQEDGLRRDRVLRSFAVNYAGRRYDLVSTIFELQKEILLLHQNTPALSRLDRPLETMGRAAKVPLYTVQTNVSMFFGHTRSPLAEDAFGVDAAREIGRHLQPGDVLLTRSDGYVSNLFLPGFWKHALLYAGTREQVNSQLLRDPRLAARFNKYIRKHAKPTGGRGVTIEAIGEGVVVSDLPTSLQANYVIALRPRAPAAKRLVALRKSLAFLGTPYDFDFDFTTTGRLVCSELVYQVYALLGAPFRFPLSTIAGRKVVAPYAFVQQALGEEHKGVKPRAFDVVLIAASGNKGKLKWLRVAGQDKKLDDLTAKSIDSMGRTKL